MGMRDRTDIERKEVTMRLVKIRGRLPLQRCTGSKYRISVLLDCDSRSESETV